MLLRVSPLVILLEDDATMAGIGLVGKFHHWHNNISTSRG